MIKLSIVIPYHNNYDQLVILLESIPQEPWIEVLVVDDHSKVPLSKLDHCNVKVIHQASNKRWAGAARNTGLKEAIGDYVLFADSDDYFVEGAFDIIRGLCGNDDLVFFRPTSVMEDGTRSDRHVSYAELIESYCTNGSKDILYKFHVPWSKLYRRQYLVDNRIFFDEVVASNDVNFSLKSSLLSGSFKVTNDIIYCVVESCSSLTKNKSEKVIDSRFDALSRYNDFLISISDENLAAMSGHLKNSMSFGFSKFMYRFFYCINRGYPLFYNISHVIRAMRHLRAKRRG